MISHKHQCIFIHIPKCAGTSIETALGHYEQFDGPAGQDHRSVRQLEQPILANHVLSSGANLYEAFRRVRNKRPSLRSKNPNNRLMVTQEQYDRYFKFTVIRNPWSRVYSWYNHVMRDEYQRNNHAITSDLTLNQFIHRFKRKGCLRPQTYWLKDFSGAIPMDFIGRFEQLHEDFQTICLSMGTDPITLPHRLKGSSEHYVDHYDAESIRIIEELYHEEIALFGYTFEN